MWFIVRNIYLVFVPVSATKGLKLLYFLGDELHNFCYISEVTFWKP